MNYKIASLILNASKHQTGSREVFISQPDSQKESLAGKIFIMAEIGGKKNEAKKAIDFLLESIDKFYYQDEKIFLQDKIEGLSLENIFEVALSKTNKALLEFLNEEKIFLHPKESSLIVGLIFENKLFFSNFGSHKAFLINKNEDKYELINVEASATDIDTINQDDSENTPKFFSSVISGKIPNSSYFLFCNEVLVEYLSNEDLINVITKLPPIVAAEQIKNSLAKLNSYAPFLGLIIKNTHGLSLAEIKDENQIESQKTAHSSVSYLKDTEKETEKMLSPAGVFNWQKLVKVYQKIISKTKSVKKEKVNKKSPSLEISKEAKEATDTALKKNKTVSASKMLKEKLIVGRSRSRIFSLLKIIWSTLINIINPLFWAKTWKSFSLWLSRLHPRNKLMFVFLLLFILVLVFSIFMTISNNKKQAQVEKFNELISSLEIKNDMVESYLLYDNQVAARNLIGEVLMGINTIEPRGAEQIDRLDKLREQISEKRAKVQKLTVIENPQHIFNFKDHNSSAETRNLIIFNNKLYSSDALAKAVYIWDLESEKVDSFLLSGDISSLDKPSIDNNLIYYLDRLSLISVNPENGRQSRLSIAGLAEDNNIDDFDFYGNFLYLMMSENNQVYRLSATSPNFNNRTSRLPDDAHLGKSVDMVITDAGNISVLKSDAKIDDFRGAVLQDFKLDDVDPSLDSASLLKFVGNRYFVLDRASKRLLAFDIRGRLIQQYHLPSLNNIKDFSVSTDDKVYILNNDSIYSLDLNL